ncbi:MAG: VOC family protein [Planctomycetota bacterium]
MTFKGIMYLFQYVSDLQASADFYTALGFKLGTNEQDVRGFSFGSGYLVIHTDTREKNPGKFQGGTYPAVHVEDVDALHAEYTAKGLKPDEPSNMPWGERSFRVDDPDGYTWTFAMAVTPGA